MSQYPKFYTSCGSPINPGQKFCTTCGAAITENSSDLSSNLSNSSGPGDTSPMPVVDPRTVSYPDDTQVLNSQDVQNRQYRQPCNSESQFRFEETCIYYSDCCSCNCCSGSCRRVAV